MAQPATNHPPTAEHNSFGKVAIKLGYITEGQLDEAMRVQATAAKAGLRKRLGEILIKKGYLTPEQFQEVLKSQTVKSKRIGAYELISKLGEGGMGSVFKARQVFMDRVIALKILAPKMAKNKDFRERFVREARAVAKLNHPNIVAGIDVGSADGYCYFAMEYVDGESLGQYMHRKGGKLDEAVCLEFARQAGMALHHAHQNNLLHRDVKPDNLLLDKERNIVKLADLGLARSAESAEDDAALTQAGQAVGTPFYISPEQARGLSDLTPATDIYSLGASMFHLLTGQVPFDGATAAVIMTRHLTDPVPNMRKLNPKISEAVEKIVLKCMQKKPEDRYHGVMELVAEIERLQGGGVAQTGSVRRHRGSARPANREKEKKVLLARPSASTSSAGAEDEDDDGGGPERERLSKTSVGSTHSVTATRSFKRRRTSSDMGGFLFIVLLLFGGAAALYLLKPELFIAAPMKHTGPPLRPAPTPAPQFKPDPAQPPPAAVPARIVRTTGQPFVYKVNFENDFSAFEADPALLKGGDRIELIDDAARTNHVLKLPKIRPLGEPQAGSMVRLALPPDLQLTGKAALKFKLCVNKSSDPNPEVYIYWDNLREGAGARALATWTLKTKAGSAWDDVSVELDQAPNRLQSRVSPDKPQFIAIYAGKPDAPEDVFIDELELSDGPLDSATPETAPASGNREAPVAPPPSGNREAPVAPPPDNAREAPVAPPPHRKRGRKNDASDALDRAM